MPCVDSSHSHLPCPALPPSAVYPVLFHILRSTNFAQKIANPIHMSVTLNPRTYRRNMANPALLLLPAANLLFIFFSSSVLIILMFSQHLLDDFWKCFEATSSLSSRFKFMHIAYVNSSAQGRMTEGRKDVDMLLWIYAHMCICICILDWLLLPFRQIICIFAFQFADIFSFLFFVLHLLLPKKFNCQ